MSDKTGQSTGKVTQNVASNYVATIWTAVSTFATIPLVVHFVGISGYGIVGFWIALQSIVALLDVGLSTTLNRELARLAGRDGWLSESRDLLRSLEVIYWLLAVAAGVAIFATAPLVSSHILGGHSTVTPTLILLIGLTITLEFPFVLYAGGLMGLQSQVSLNVVNVIAASLRSFGAVGILFLVSPTVEEYFVWQTIVSALQSAGTAFLLWRKLGGVRQARFSFGSVRQVGRFSLALAGITVLGALLSQVPRLELSAILPLKQYGYYSLALVLASGLYAVITPIFQGVFPRITELVSKGGMQEELVAVYHRSSQSVAVAALPVACVLAFMSRPVVRLWTDSSSIAGGTAAILTLLAIGTGLHTLYWIPYAAQLAHGWTKLALIQNAAALLVLAPLTVVLAVSWGAAGAAAGWIGLNVLYLSCGVWVMHSRILVTERLRWYRDSLVAPGIAATVAVGIVWLAGREIHNTNLPFLVAEVALGLGGGFLAALFATPTTRRFAQQMLRSPSHRKPIVTRAAA